ncbi:hypothetical protein ACM6N5_03450 [Rossellomorea marisflavi]|uniref:hypothetical protein n=1 Tax=Rossellomorea marisflavi TaxID=189381 RepID=UPI003AE0E62F
MNEQICTTCGVQYHSAAEMSSCLICTEERQYVNPNGQSWTTLEQLTASGVYKNEIVQEEEGLYSITTTPSFGIGQTAYLIQEAGFNVLWDCITYLDAETIATIRESGGIQAIALSHPHYYSTQVEWAEAFDAPIYIHEDDREWVTRPSERIIYWSGEALELHEEVTIHRIGGHFKGGSILHWRSGADKLGGLLTGDVIQVVADRNWVSFMYSYPNLIPLPAHKVKEMATQVKPLPFDRLYNAFHRVVTRGANAKVQASAERYIAALEGTLFHT